MRVTRACPAVLPGVRTDRLRTMCKAFFVWGAAEDAASVMGDLSCSATW